MTFGCSYDQPCSAKAFGGIQMMMRVTIRWRACFERSSIAEPWPRSSSAVVTGTVRVQLCRWNGGWPIYTDGRAMATIQSAARTQNVRVSAGTLKVKGEAVCATLKGCHLSRVSISTDWRAELSRIAYRVGGSRIAILVRRVSSASVKNSKLTRARHARALTRVPPGMWSGAICNDPAADCEAV